jgi:hypothetical protein
MKRKANSMASEEYGTSIGVYSQIHFEAHIMISSDEKRKYCAKNDFLIIYSIYICENKFYHFFNTVYLHLCYIVAFEVSESTKMSVQQHETLSSFLECRSFKNSKLQRT